MGTANLTDAMVRSAKAKPKQRLELWDTHTRGLCLRVSPERKIWVVRYRVDGKQRRFVLDDYENLALVDARIDAAALLRKVRKEGADPAGEAKRRQDAQRDQPIKTFNDLADAYLTACRNGHWMPRGRRQSDRTIDDVEDQLRLHARPVLGALPLADVTRREVRALLRSMMDEGIVPTAKHVLQAIRQVYAWAISEFEGELVQVNVGVGHPMPASVPKQRTLSDVELRLLWVGLKDPANLRLPVSDGETEGDRVHLSRPLAIILQLCVLLLQRRAEIAGMRLSEVNLELGVWAIPADRMKGRRPHTVPLPPLAVELIQEAISLAQPAWTARAKALEVAVPNDGPVFPSPRDAFTPVLANSVTHVMKEVTAALEIKGASPHDLRRTGSTALTSERLGVSPFIRSLVLSHASDTGGGAAVSSVHYDTNSYLSEKRRALAAWEGLVVEIVGEREAPDNVARLGGRVRA